MPMNLNSELVQTLHQQAAATYDDLRQIRRHLHRFPELSGDEAQTVAYLLEKLQGLGLTFRTNLSGHGFIADLISDPSKDTLALRLDLDALSIQEESQASYHSQIPGVMHACGHDVHSTIGVGVARVLASIREDLPVNIRFIFQPEEEEITGALNMIEAGALKDPIPKAIWGLHVAPFPTGNIAWTDNLFLAGFEHYLGVLYPEGDNELPTEFMAEKAQKCCDAIIALNRWHLPQTWEAMQSFWQTMQAGSPGLKKFIVFDASTNSEEPELWHGQFGIGIKAASSVLYQRAIEQIQAELDQICASIPLNYRLLLMGSMEAVRNDPALVKTALPALQRTIGEDHLIKLNAAFPFNCEDFTYYTKHIPGAMIWLGAANPISGKYAMLHTPNFDVDETCLLTGTIAMASLLIGSSNFSQINPPTYINC